MNKKIELLAPAGDFDSLRAAVENGADAVYLGGKLFNARQYAGNFDVQKLGEALDYAHVRGVEIYLAMNTLVSGLEMRQAVEFAQEAYLLGIDGIIVQDIGFAAILKKLVPDLPLHASTQMTVHNPEGVRLLEKMGFKRVVTARELTLEEIRQISSAASIEIEIFIHGALCICYSGQCLMSSIIGGRSGNRGKCAQPCRLPYRLLEGENFSACKTEDAARYLLSPKDLCTLPQLDKIAASGVKSLKIEGRMKSPEYVATVVRVYRKFLNLALEGNFPGNDFFTPDNEYIYELAQVFNRGGFTGGFMTGKTGKDMMCYEKPKNWGTFLGEVLSYDRISGIAKVRLVGNLAIGDGIEVWNGESENPGTIVTIIRINDKNVREAFKSDVAGIGNIKGKIFKGCKVYKTSDKRLLEAARESFEGKPQKRIEIKGEAILKKDLPLILKVFDEDGNTSEAESSTLPERALIKPLSVERLRGQIEKTGSTPFKFSNLIIDLDDGLSTPVGEINEVRRKALEELEHKRTQKYSRVITKENKGVGYKESGKFDGAVEASSRTKPLISLYFYEWNPEADYAGLGADRLYIPFKALLKNEDANKLSEIRKTGIELFIWTPVIIRGSYYELIKEKTADPDLTSIDGILAGSPSIALIKGDATKIKLLGDYSFNIFNSDSAQVYKSMGFKGITLSPELNLAQICDISEKLIIEAESIVYGRLPLMTSEYCPVGSVKDGFSSGKKCSGSCSKAEYHLKDRLGIEFPLICDKIDCRSTILNSNVLFVPDALKRLTDAGISSLRLYIKDESPEDIRVLVELHRKAAINADISEYTALTKHIKSEGFTKGHFYKGV